MTRRGRSFLAHLHSAAGIVEPPDPGPLAAAFVIVVGLLLGLIVFRDAFVTAFQRLADLVRGLSGSG